MLLRLVFLFFVAAGFIFAGARAFAQTVVYDPPLVFAEIEDITCPAELRVHNEIEQFKVANEAASLMMFCKPVFKHYCYVDPTKNEKATFRFDLTAEGRPHNIRLKSTTNACLNKFAGLSLQLSLFNPLEGGAADLEGVMQLEFDDSGWEKYEEPLRFKMRDNPRCGWKMKERLSDDWRSNIGLSPRVLKRCPPQYPDRCQRKAMSWEGVLVHYDVAPNGDIENVRVPASTNKCFAKNAAKSVAAWQYEPSEQRWEGLSTVVVFQLSR